MSSAIVPANTSSAAANTSSVAVSTCSVGVNTEKVPLTNVSKGKEFEAKISRILKTAEIKSWRLQ